MRVLVVEDEKSLRQLLSNVLTQRGHDVVQAEDAERALSLYREAAFPLVVLDWVLPGMSGLDFCRVIRKLPGGEEPFVLLTTARTSQHDLDLSLASGVDDYLAKPIDMGLLDTRIAVAERAVAQRAKRREAEHRFESVFRGSPDAIAIVRQSNGAIVDANDSFARLFGVPRAQLFESTLVHDRLLKKLDLRTRVTSEPVSITRDVDVVQTLTSAEPIDVGGVPCWLVMCHDVTERERLRSQLMFADKMASVGTLAAGVAHEINNPLAYVMANVGFVNDELKRSTADKEMVDALEEALHGAERVKNIVRDLKSFSRDDEEQLGPVDVKDVLDSAINLAWNEIRHRARLVKEYEDVPPVFGNKGRLGQVFVNLLINAAQAIAEGDAKKNEIRVVTRRDAQGRVIVEVRDTGPGIKPEHMRRIFDPFFTTKAVGVGTGLGLSICHAIVSSLGGDIVAESELGRGASFAVALSPTVASLDSAALAGRTQPGAGRRGRVLLIDDEAMIGKSLLRALSADHELESVVSATEALDRLRSGQDYDVILCDLMMPEMSGMEFHAQVAKHHAHALPKIVFVTGGAFTPKAREFVDALKTPVLEKPLDMLVLKRMIRDRVEIQRDTARVS